MLPSANLDTFQQQLDSLQKSYSQLGKTPGIQPLVPEKHEVLRVPGIADAKTFARERLAPGESAVLFDENEDLFYFTSKSQEGIVQPLMLGRFTLEPEPPKPEYATKQDFESLKAEILDLLKKENKA